MQRPAPLPPRAPLPRTSSTALLFSITFLAALVRLNGISADGLSSDEAFSWRMVSYPWGELLRRAAADVHPPLYYLLLKPWLALTGDTPLALRGLSVVFGVLVVPLVYALVREGQRLARPAPQDSAVGRWPALLAALLVALHPAQVMASQNARMYTLSAALIALATTLLLRAIRTGRGWWVYGLAAAAPCATHYYGFFSVAAQVVGAALLVRRVDPETNAPSAARLARGLTVAGVVAALLYATWLPAFIGQVVRVSANYWIPAVSWLRVSTAFASWASGLEREALGGAAIWIAALTALATLAATWRADRVSLFVIVQAAAPWLFGLAISIATPRSIFLPRYLVPVQIFLLIFWAARAFETRVTWLRLGLVASLIGLSTLWLVRAKAQVPSEPLAEVRAADFLAQRYQSGDVVLTDSPRASNRLRYYLAQRGVRSPVMHCLLAPSAEDVGHFAHTASLAADELIRPRVLDSADWRRLWWGTPTSAEERLPSRRWQQVVIRHFSAGGTHYMLTRYVPARQPAPGSVGSSQDVD
jgi:mannosyltransferase